MRPHRGAALPAMERWADYIAYPRSKPVDKPTATTRIRQLSVMQSGDTSILPHAASHHNILRKYPDPRKLFFLLAP